MRAIEAQLQDSLLEAVFRRSDLVAGAHSPFEQGMAIYRNNGSANAVRAMAVMFPAVHALLGEDDFYPLARFRRAAGRFRFNAAKQLWSSRASLRGLIHAPCLLRGTRLYQRREHSFVRAS